VTVKEYAQLYRASERTVKRWKAQGLPLRDEAAMREIIASKRSHIGRRKGIGGGQITVLKPAQPTTPIAIDVGALTAAADRVSTLAHLIEGERIAYRRYIESGGDERAALVWTQISEAKRRAEESAAKHASDVTEVETKLTAAMLEIYWRLRDWVQNYPKVHAILCENYDRHQIEPILRDGVNQIFDRVSSELIELIESVPALKQALANLP
jgi:hypothetical protein